MLNKIQEAKLMLEGLEVENSKYVTSDPRIFAEKGMETFFSIPTPISLTLTINSL